MQNTGLWLTFASLTVIGSLGYNVSTKLASDGMSAFVFSWLLTATSFVILSVVMVFQHHHEAAKIISSFDSKTLALPMIAGLSVAIIDVAYFLTLKHGSAISSQMFWTVGSTILLVVFSVLFLKEILTPSKIAGLALGLLSVYLMVKQ